MASSRVTVRILGHPHSRQIRARGVTADAYFAIPKGYMISSMLIEELAGNAVTGGLDVGTSDGGQQVVAAITVGANGIVHVPDTSLLKRFFSRTADTNLYLTAASAWNSAELDVTVVLDKVYP